MEHVTEVVTRNDGYIAGICRATFRRVMVILQENVIGLICCVGGTEQINGYIAEASVFPEVITRKFAGNADYIGGVAGSDSRKWKENADYITGVLGLAFGVGGSDNKVERKC